MRWLLFGLWCLLITVASSIPGHKTPGLGFEHADKVVHFGLFFVGAWLLAGALRHSTKWSGWVVIPLVVVALSVIGAADELYQLNTPGRSGADVGDWIADTLGGIFGAVMIYAWHGFVRRIVRPKPDSDPPAAGRAG